MLKILRFFILILLWGTITLIILSLKNDVQFTFSEFLYNLIALKQGWTNHLWFLYALALVYFIFPILKVTFDNNKKIFIFFVVFCLVVTIGNKFLNLIIFIFNFLCFNSVSNINFNLFNLFNIFGIYGFSFAYFCLGGVAYYLLPKIKNFNKVKTSLICYITIFISTVIWFLLSIFISKAQNKILDNVWEGYDTIFAFINTICMFSILVNIKVKNKKIEKIFKLISTNTLGIYLVHWIIISLLSTYIKKVAIFCTFSLNIIYSLLILLVCLLVSWLLKKIPIIKKMI